MKALVATRRSQGEREGDYMHAVPGELIRITEVCDTDRRYPARGCGCGRGFGGLASHRATTTVEVVALAMSTDELRMAFATSLRDQGWIAADDDAELAEAIVAEAVGLMRAVAEVVPVGAVVRRHVDEFHAHVTIN